MKILMTILTALVLISCASQSVSDKNDRYAQFISDNNLESVDRITTFRFHGWSALNSDYLIISTNFKSPYLIKLKSPCNDLKFSQTISVNNTGSSLSSKFDSIDVPGPIEQTCYIDEIYPMTEEQSKVIRSLEKS